MCAGPDQLWKRGEYTQLERAGPKEQRKRGEILLTAALGDGLTGTISKAIPAARFSEVLFDGLLKAHRPRLMN